MKSKNSIGSLELLSILTCCSLILSCSNSTTATSNSGPTVGSTYQVLSVSSLLNRPNQTIDTLSYFIDGINLPYKGRTSVSRIILSKFGMIYDTLYYNYLPSGDVEILNSDSSWEYLPVKTQTTSTIIVDTMTERQGQRLVPTRDTTVIAGIGGWTESIMGSTFNDERVSYSRSGIIQGEPPIISHSIISYVPDLKFFGYTTDTVQDVETGLTTVSSETLIGYNLK